MANRRRNDAGPGCHDERATFRVLPILTLNSVDKQFTGSVCHASRAGAEEVLVYKSCDDTHRLTNETAGNAVSETVPQEDAHPGRPTRPPPGTARSRNSLGYLLLMPVKSAVLVRVSPVRPLLTGRSAEAATPCRSRTRVRWRAHHLSSGSTDASGHASPESFVCSCHSLHSWFNCSRAAAVAGIRRGS